MKRNKRLVVSLEEADPVNAALKKIEAKKEEAWVKNRALIKKQAEELEKEIPKICWPKSDQLSNVVAKGQKSARVYNEFSKKVSQRVPMRMYDPVKPTPPMTTWVPIPKNLKTKDEEALLNIPYLGDDTDETFLKDLIEQYDGKIHGIEQTKILDDATFMELVELLTKKTKNARDPPMMVFEAISAKIPEIGTAEALKTRYMQLKEPADSLPKCSPNIDGEMKGVGRDQTLQAYRKHFCRQCYTYSCFLHSSDPQEKKIPGPSMQKKPVPMLKPPRKPCGPNCFQRLDRMDTKVKTSAIWSGSDDTLFRVLSPIFGKNYCAIAQSMRTKTCQQVYEYSQKAEVAVGGVGLPSSSSHGKKMSAPHPMHAPSFKLKQKIDSENKSNTIYSYTPCNHAGPCSENSKSCSCVASLNFCEKFCLCSSDCRNRAPFCRCKLGQCLTKMCPCYAASRECDPDRCGTCGAGKFDGSVIRCKKIGIQRGQQKLLKIAQSKVAGWGCFLAEDVKKSELISEYRGEIISQKEADRRGKVYDKKNSNFLFALTKDQVIDATRYGNEVRFMNHSNTPNCYAKVLMVNGNYRIGIFAKKNLKIGEELFYDYGKDFKF